MHRVHAKWKCTVCKYFYLPECKHRVECPLCSPSVVAGLSVLQFPWWNPHNRSNSSIFGGSPLKKFTSFFFQFNTLSSTIIHIYISEDTNRASVLHSIHRWKDILVIFFFNSSIFSSPLSKHKKGKHNNRYTNNKKSRISRQLRNTQKIYRRICCQGSIRDYSKNDLVTSPMKCATTYSISLLENSLPSSRIVFDSSRGRRISRLTKRPRVSNTQNRNLVNVLARC